MWLFDGDGFNGALRMAHVIVGIMWMGLLWFFNVVQVPAYAEMGAGSRTEALDKLTWRALWWFRWAAMATVAIGVLMIGIESGDDGIYNGDYWRSPAGMTLLVGVVLGITMFANVWFVIWPNQQVVIGSARKVLAGGEADPEAAAAGRKALLASRMNTIFSLPLLVFMVGATHFYASRHWVTRVDGSDIAVWLIVSLAIWGLLELGALGLLGGTAPGGPRIIFDTHANALWTGAALIVILYLLSEAVFRA